MVFDIHERISKPYFIKFGINLVDDLNDRNSFLIMKSAYQDFRNEKLSFDDFSTLGEFLFNKLNPNSKSSSLGSVLLEIAELSDFVREDKDFLNLTGALKKIQFYFK